MIKFSELLTPENIRVGLVCSSKKRTFEILSQVFAPQLGEENKADCDQNTSISEPNDNKQQAATPSEEELLEEKEKEKENETCCIECLLNREKLGNSALGNGVAIPKGRLKEGSQPLAAFLQLNQGIDYGSADGKPVDLILALLLPTEFCETYAKELPILAKRLTDKNLCKQLRGAQNAKDLWEILKHNDEAFEAELHQTQCEETINQENSSEI